MASVNNVKNVAIVGAGGNCGRYIAEALLSTSKHTVTAITRYSSTTQLPAGIHAIKKIDYEKPSTLVDALVGQDVLVITLSGYASRDTEEKLIEAAIEAGVPFVLPNEWSPDTANEALIKDVFPFASKMQIRTKVATEGKGKTHYIAVTTGFWYEWSLAIAPAYGFDFADRSVVFFDDGKTITNTSTWPQVGRAVAALLSLPIQPESDDDKCLSRLKNQQVYISSFAVSQMDIFESVLRVTGTKPDEWKTTHESTQERYVNGLEAMKQGQRVGFAKMMYTRVFYKDGSGNFEKTKGTLNALLDLPEESIDDFTAIAIKRSKEVQWA